MPRLNARLMLLFLCVSLVACAQTPATATVTLAKLPVASPTPAPAPFRTAATATEAPTEPPARDAPPALSATLPAPTFRLIPDLGIAAEYRTDAADISYGASANGFAWARVEFAADGTNRYPGFVFVPSYNLQEMRLVNANHPVALVVESGQERVVTGAVDGAIEIWNAQTGMRDQRIGQVTGQPTSIAINADDSLIAVGAKGRYAGGDGSVTIWKKDEAEPLKVLPTYGAVTRVAFALNSKTLYFSTNASSCSRGGGGVFMWNTELAEAKQVFSASGNPVLDFAIDPSGKYIASVGQNGSTRCNGLSAVSVWDAGSGQVVQVLPQTEHAGDGSTAARDCASIAFSPDSKRLAVGDTLGNFSIWRWEQPKMEKAFEFSTNPISRVIWSADNMLFLDDDDSYVRLFYAP